MFTNRRSFTSILGVLITFAVAAPAFALPVGSEKDAREAQKAAPSWAELEAAGVDFTAIVALSNCSGSLVRFTTSQPTDKAMVLSNGHCVGGFITAGDAIISQSSSRSFSLLSASGTS